MGSTSTSPRQASASPCIPSMPPARRRCSAPPTRRCIRRNCNTPAITPRRFSTTDKIGKVLAFPNKDSPYMPAPALSGPHYLREGLHLVLSPGLRLFVLLPLSINLLLFAALIGLALRQFGLWVDYFMPSLPDW